MKEPPAKAHFSARDCWQAIQNRSGVLFLSFCLAFMAAVVAVTAVRPSFFPPLKYTGRVLMQVEYLADPTTSDVVRSEFAVITSKETLSKVVAKLDLVDRWKLGSLDQACVTLSSMIDISEEPGTDLIAIKVLGTDKDEAAELANAVADAYVNRRKEIKAERVQTGFHMLSQAIDGQTREVERARAKMLEIVQEGIGFGYGSRDRFTRWAGSHDGPNSDLLDARRTATAPRNKEGEELLANVERITAETKADGIGDPDPEMYARYQQAVDAWKMANHILDQMIQEQERARSVFITPRKPATIHERAVPAKTNSSWSPNFALQLGLVMLGVLFGLLLGLGLAFFFGVRVMNRPGAAR